MRIRVIATGGTIDKACFVADPAPASPALKTRLQSPP